MKKCQVKGCVKDGTHPLKLFGKLESGSAKWEAEIGLCDDHLAAFDGSDPLKFSITQSVKG